LPKINFTEKIIDKKLLAAKEEIKNKSLEKMITLLLGGFGVVAALAWNEAVKSLFDLLFGAERGGIGAKFFYAVIVTLVVVIVSIRLGKITEKIAAEEEEKKEKI
jgi:hypothetical protein